MRILYVTDSLRIGGAETLLLAMVRDFRARGHDIALAYFTDGPLHSDFEALGVTPCRLARHGLKDPRALARLMRLIRRHRPDVVHTHLRKSDLAGQLGAVLMRIPVRVSTAHNVDPWRRNKVLSLVADVCMTGCQKIIAVSSEVRDYMIEVAGTPADDVITIANGIDLERFDPASVAPLDKRDRWGFAPQDPVVGIVGRLEAQKDHETFLSAAKLVSERRPHTRFLIIGEGERRDSLEKRATKLGLAQHVVFAGLERDMPAMLATLDIVVFSSRWEGLPVALLEAMAMSRPVVATAVGGMPGLIEDGETGILVPPGDAQSLANGIMRLLKDTTLAGRLARRCRPLISQRYGVRRMHDQILELYETLGRKESRQRG